MLYHAIHVTRYRYEDPVSQCFNEAHLTPRSFPGQHVYRSDIKVNPEPAVFEQRLDYFGNGVSTFAIFRTHDLLSTTATSVVELRAQPAVEPPTITWEEARDQVAKHQDDESLRALEFIFDSPYVATGIDLAEYVKPTFTPGRPLVDALHELMHRIHEEFKYVPKSTSIDMPLLEVLKNKCGVCQDFAHIMIGGLRSLNLAARYVSGYLRSGAKFTGAEASHAWVSVFVPGAGWWSFDPTNDVVPTDGHLTLGWGRDYGDVTPMKGITLGGSSQRVEVEVQVRPVELP